MYQVDLWNARYSQHLSGEVHRLILLPTHHFIICIVISRPNVFIRNIRQHEAFNPCRKSASTFLWKSTWSQSSVLNFHARTSHHLCYRWVGRRRPGFYPCIESMHSSDYLGWHWDRQHQLHCCSKFRPTLRIWNSIILNDELIINAFFSFIYIAWVFLKF